MFDLLSTDINRFDVETHLSPVDLRSRRLSLTADSLRNRLLLDRYADDAGLEMKAFLDVLESTGERARTLPATLHVQITDGSLQVPVWSPVKSFLPQTLTSRDALTRERWNDLLDQALAWAGDLTVLPSFWGRTVAPPRYRGAAVRRSGQTGFEALSRGPRDYGLEPGTTSRPWRRRRAEGSIGLSNSTPTSKPRTPP